MSAVVMSAAAEQQLAMRCMRRRSHSGSCPSVKTLLNNRKCGASERRFPTTKEYLITLSQLRCAHPQNVHQLHSRSKTFKERRLEGAPN